MDLVDPAVAVLPDPERSLGPGQPGIAATAGGRDGGDDVAGSGIDLLDAVPGDLEQVTAVEGGAGVCGDLDRVQRLPILGVDRRQAVAGREPDPATVADRKSTRLNSSH